MLCKFNTILFRCTLVSYARRREVGGKSVFYPIVLAMIIVSATARILKMASPRFDNMVAHEAQLKGRLRYLHSRIITNSEEIAFYKGHQVEHGLLRRAFRELCQQTLHIYKKRIPYVAIEQFLMKYIWSGTGLLVSSLVLSTICSVLKSNLDDSDSHFVHPQHQNR